MRKYSEKKRLYTLIFVMAGAVAITVLVTLVLLYQQAFNSYKEQLHTSAVSQQELIAAVGRFDASNSQQDHAGGAIGGTLSQVIDAHGHFRHSEQSHEFVLLEHADDRFDVIIHHYGDTVITSNRYSLGGKQLALPDWIRNNQQALSGAQGSWQNNRVIAVFTLVSIAGKQFYIIEKIDIAEIRQPFIQAFLIAIFIALMVILLGSSIITRQVNPIIHGLNEQVSFNKIILDTAIIPIITTDEQNHITSINKATSDTFGYTEFELLEKPVSTLFDIDKDETGFETRGYKFNKDELTLSIALGISDTEEGRIKVFIATDVTQIKLAEEQLRDATAHNAAIVDTVPETIFTLDELGNIESANPSAEKAFGFFVGELERLNIYQLVSKMPDLTEPCKNIETFAQHKEGKLFPVEVSIAHFYIKNKLNVSCIIRDITERKAAEEKITRHQQHLQDMVDDATLEIKAIVDTAVVGIITINQKGKVQTFNPAAESIFGYTSEEIIGKNVACLMADNSEQEHNNYINRYLKTRQARIMGQRVEFEACRKDGTIIPINLAIGHKELNNNEHLFVAYVTDITQARKAQLELIDAKNKAVEAATVKANFLANMSHEIRTPMNAIIGFADVLAGNPSIDSSGKEHIQTIRNSGRSLLNIINDILDFSKFEAGKMELESVNFNLGNLMRDCLKVMELKADEKNILLRLEVHCNEPFRVMGDPTRIRQIVMNLLSNAVKFTEQGSVCVSVNLHADNAVKISVADTGIGMDKAQLDTVFESFSQADSSTTRKFGGTGLGTTISQQLVHAMGGEIWAESVKGEGSTFHFTAHMPQSNTEEGCLFEDLNDDVEEAYSPRIFNVLLAEDIAENASLAILRLEEQGHQVYWAKNGREALQALDEQPFDLILMDVMMPEIDGLEATVKIRESQREYADICIIALTASVMQEDHQRCLQAGMTDVESKPIEFSSLFKSMEKHVAEALGKTNEKTEVVVQQEIDLTPLEEVADTAKALNVWRYPKAYIKACSSYAEDKKDAAKQLRQDISAELFEQARNLVHAIKGVAGNLQFLHVFHSAQLIDEMLKGNPDVDKLLEEVDVFERHQQSLIAAVKQLATTSQEQQQLKCFDEQKIGQLIAQLLASLDNFNPDSAQPFILQLSEFISQSELAPIAEPLEQFDFDETRQQILKLANQYKLTIATDV